MQLPFDNIAFIVALEVAAVLFVFCLILFIQNRSLRGVIKKLRARMMELVEDLKAAKAAPTPPPSIEEVKPEITPEDLQKEFLKHINEQIEYTKAHHATLEPDQDIVLDLSPDVLLPRRAAALRYVMLLTEKEAISAARESEELIDWSLLRAKYHQIFDFYEDYTATPETGGNKEEIDALTQELTNAKKRVNNLEKFKALFFDLEAQWESSKKDAETHYENLTEMASEVENAEEFGQALRNYHSAYKNIDGMIERGIGDPETIIQSSKITDEKTAGELRHLRQVAADQHKIITELESKLQGASSEEERGTLIEGLKSELDKQKRFIQESETCVQLMEEELNNAHKELSQLKDRLKALPSIKVQMQELRKSKDEYELKFYSATSENRKLLKKIKDDKVSSLVIEGGDTIRLKKELADLESRYATLEEKYLDLKMQ